MVPAFVTLVTQTLSPPPIPYFFPPLWSAFVITYVLKSSSVLPRSSHNDFSLFPGCPSFLLSYCESFIYEWETCMTSHLLMFHRKSWVFLAWMKSSVWNSSKPAEPPPSLSRTPQLGSHTEVLSLPNSMGSYFLNSVVSWAPPFLEAPFPKSTQIQSSLPGQQHTGLCSDQGNALLLLSADVQTEVFRGCSSGWRLASTSA